MLLEETNPNAVYDLKNTLDEFRIYQQMEVNKFANIFYSDEEQSAGDLGKLQGAIKPELDRYDVLEIERQDLVRAT